MLFSLRSRTVRGIRNNFRGMFPDTNCPLCGLHLDTLPGVLTCTGLVKELTREELANMSGSYIDVFSADTVVQRNIVDIFSRLLAIKEKLLEIPEDTVSCTPDGMQ